MLKTRIVVIILLVIGFVGFHLVERSWHGGEVPSFLEELLFIGGLVFGVSLLVAGVFLRLIRRVNQVSSRALEICTPTTDGQARRGQRRHRSG